MYSDNKILNMKIFKFLSIELIFAIFLLSGDIKGIFFMHKLGNIPDLTLISAIILTIVLVFNHKNLKFISMESHFAISTLIILFILMLFSLTYTSSLGYSIKKTAYFSLILLSLIVPITVKKFNINRFMLIFSLTTFLITVIYLKFLFAYVNGSLLTNLNADEIVLARGMYLTLSYSNGIVFLYYFFNKHSHNYRFLFIFISLLFMVLAGGRGVLLFTFLILLFYSMQRLVLFFKTQKIKTNTIIGIIIFSIAVFVVSVNNTELVNRTIERLSMLVGGESARVRMEYLIFALEKINNAPILGYGIGSFGLEYSGIDQRLYPHNVFVEIWFELGLLPLIVFLVFNLIVLQSIIVSKCYWCLALYIYLFLNILKSNSLTDLRILIGFFGIFLMIHTTRKEYKIENS